MLKLERYLVIFSDAASSKENFLNPSGQKFAYGFTSCLIYLVHRCQKTSELQASLLSAYNKLSTPNQDIIRYEANGPVLACKRAPYFAKLFGISPENIIFFSDNLAFLSLVKNFDKNYLTYKPFYLKTIKHIIDLGMLPSKFYYVNTELNISDVYTRPVSMDISNIDKVLGEFDENGFNLHSPIFGYFNIGQYFESLKTLPPEDWDIQIQGVYKSGAQVFLNLTTPPQVAPPLAVASLCHSTSVKTRGGKLILSHCNKKMWSSYDFINDQKHVSRYFLHRFGNFEKIIRVFYIVLKFSCIMLSKIRIRKCVLQPENFNDLINRSSYYLSYQVVCSMFHNLGTHSSLCERMEGDVGHMKLTITKFEYDIGFHTFLRELQMYLLPQVFLDLKSQFFSTLLPDFKGLLIFVDKFGILIMLSAFNPTCQPINTEYIMANLNRSKLVIPVVRTNKVFALKLIAKTHKNLNCCGVTYLIQALNEKYYIHDLTRLCKNVVETCFRCQRNRLIQGKKYVSNPLYSYPRDHKLSLTPESLSHELNSVWQVDLVPRIRIKNSSYTFVQASDNNKYKDLTQTNIFCNILVFINSRTNYVHFELLYTKSFQDLKIVFETFLHKYSLSSIPEEELDDAKQNQKLGFGSKGYHNKTHNKAEKASNNYKHIRNVESNFKKLNLAHVHQNARHPVNRFKY